MINRTSNPNAYAAVEQDMFDKMMKDTDYETFTTFYGDLSIAELYGIDSVIDTYNRVVDNWGTDIKWITEFSICLSVKTGEMYAEDEYELESVYSQLIDKLTEFIYNNFNEEDLRYYKYTYDGLDKLFNDREI